MALPLHQARVSLRFCRAGGGVVNKGCFRAGGGVVNNGCFSAQDLYVQVKQQRGGVRTKRSLQPHSQRRTRLVIKAAFLRKLAFVSSNVCIHGKSDFGSSSLCCDSGLLGVSMSNLPMVFNESQTIRFIQRLGTRCCLRKLPKHTCRIERGYTPCVLGTR